MTMDGAFDMGNKDEGGDDVPENGENPKEVEIFGALVLDRAAGPAAVSQPRRVRSIIAWRGIAIHADILVSRLAVGMD